MTLSFTNNPLQIILYKWQTAQHHISPKTASEALFGGACAFACVWGCTVA
jgi:hypothetical protein